jgi:hypothetical protein
MAPRRTTRLDIQQAEALLPFLKAGMDGLRRSHWRPGAPVEWLVAPIVLQVLVAVSRELRIKELLAEAGYA